MSKRLYELAPRRVLSEQRLEQLGDVAAPLAPAGEDDRLAGVVVDRTSPYHRVGCAGVGIITCWPTRLHIARSVGCYEMVTSLA